MKTLQDQYNLIKEGKGNKEIFLKLIKLTKITPFLRLQMRLLQQIFYFLEP